MNILQSLFPEKFNTNSKSISGKVKVLAKPLTTQSRNDLPASEFVFPDSRKYPIPDIQHARAALARAAEWGTPKVKEKVRAAVHKKFPELNHTPSVQKYLKTKGKKKVKASVIKTDNLKKQGQIFYQS